MNWEEVKYNGYGDEEPFDIEETCFNGYQFHISYWLLVVVMIMG